MPEEQTEQPEAGQPAVSRVLVITAHPDDVDFGAAGTVAQWTDAGLEVSYCVVTNGDAGGSDPSVTRADMAAIRQAEQTAAAKQVGVTDLHFLGYPDGRVEATIALRRDLARVIRLLRPDRVVCPSPERNYARMGASHPDHRAVGAAALDAVYPDSRNPFAFPELLADEKLEPWTVGEVWISASPAPTTYVDITDTFPRKLAALRSHVSQIGDPDGLEKFLRGWLSRAAAQAGLPDGRLAEAFQVVQTG
ncbi:MAG TPA: PIG-L deacetylase family protein [Streptosporangiaceae bacterium]|nr:PIG-L deacetylase family protein [Streptosporangiaceae bacterium]